MNTSPITAQSEKGTWATVEGVAQRQNKPCRMSFVERATFRAGNDKCLHFKEFSEFVVSSKWHKIQSPENYLCQEAIYLYLLSLNLTKDII